MIYIRKNLFAAFCLFVFSLAANAAEDIAVMGLIADKAILRIDGAHHIVKQGEAPVKGLRLLAISDNRKSITLEVDGEKKVYGLGHGTNTGGSTVKLPADLSGMYRTTGKINDTAISFIIDTGATYVYLNRNMANTLGIDFLKSTKTGIAETANGPVKVYIVKLDSVQVGDIKLGNIEAAIQDSDFPSVALLGMSFLKQLEMKREGDILSLYMK